MNPDQRKSWNREYRLRGKLWRGELKEKNLLKELLIPGPTLDNGCGNGKGTPTLEDVIGLDFSSFALPLYGYKNKILGNMIYLPFKNRVFANILFIHSLDHLSENERKLALEEAARVLKDDGRVVIRVFSTLDFRYGKGREIEKDSFLRGNRIVTHYFNREEFLNMGPFKVAKVLDIDYNINIQKTAYKRREFIIILVKCKFENIR